MTRRDKLADRMQRKPKDFTFTEMIKVFTAFGYTLEQTGGSHIFFFNEETGAIFHSWKSHGRKENTIPDRDLEKAVDHLRQEGYLK